jgi:succinate dehydrogenase / fumarate reductase, membrane anchor subunit
MVNRIVTGAHYGLRDWLVQRVTAAVMAVYVLVVAVLLLRQASFGYDTWIELFSSNVMRTFSMLFLLSLFYHTWIGVRDIVMDYVKPTGIRLLLHVLVILALVLYAIWSVQILWGL